MGSTIGVHGAFYVFRRQLFSPLPLDTINDDFILPMSIVAKGYRADYDDNIKALELENASLAMDQNRRRRIAAGNVQQLIRLKALFHPRYGGVAFNFLSGKGLRCLMPYFLMMAFIGSIMLSWHSILFLGLSIMQTILYALSMYIIAFSPRRMPKILHTVAYIVSGYFAISIGNARYILGLEKGPWHRV
jgi:cellulose synthase/poly-beta-1,6-N-acetylglucosamine synthase-like glycosyltransferase